MPTASIRIARQSIMREPIYDDINADVEGAFAIHETMPPSLDGWTVTHVPTGWAFLHTRHRLACVAARAEFLASGLDWTFTDPKKLTAKHKRVGSDIKRKYEGK